LDVITCFTGTPSVKSASTPLVANDTPIAKIVDGITLFICALLTLLDIILLPFSSALFALHNNDPNQNLYYLLYYIVAFTPGLLLLQAVATLASLKIFRHFLTFRDLPQPILYCGVFNFIYCIFVFSFLLTAGIDSSVQQLLHANADYMTLYVIFMFRVGLPTFFAGIGVLYGIGYSFYRIVCWALF